VNAARRHPLQGRIWRLLLIVIDVSSPRPRNANAHGALPKQNSPRAMALLGLAAGCRGRTEPLGLISRDYQKFCV
jgi:hypothetical protein